MGDRYEERCPLCPAVLGGATREDAYQALADHGHAEHPEQARQRGA